ncbi:hypothetical protein ACFL4Z_00980 [candidate division KSB1 bacterium]
MNWTDDGVKENIVKYQLNQLIDENHRNLKYETDMNEAVKKLINHFTDDEPIIIILHSIATNGDTIGHATSGFKLLINHTLYEAYVYLYDSNFMNKEINQYS